MRINSQLFSVLPFILCFSQNAISDDMVFNYKLLAKGIVVYCGISNNPNARMLEHKEKGLFYFDKMEVYYLNRSEQEAYEKESECIYAYPVPSMYQTYPRDNNAIKEYVANVKYPSSFPGFIPVIFTPAVKNYLLRIKIHYKDLYSPSFRAIET